MPQGVRARDLRQERISARVTQTALAAHLGMNRTVLSLIENEHTPLSEDFVTTYRAGIEAIRGVATAGAS